MGRRGWFKMYAYELLYGKFKSLSAEDFGILARLFCLASDNAIQGQISFTETVAFTEEQLASVLVCPISKLQTMLQYLTKEETIKTSKGIVFIQNWSLYQSEYERQKPYRNKANNSKVTSSSYTSKLQQKLRTEVEVEVEVEKNKKKENKKTIADKINPVGIWCFAYKNKFKTQYSITQKEAGIINRLYKNHADKLIPLINAFFEAENFAKDYTINIFATQINKLNRELVIDKPKKRWDDMKQTIDGKCYPITAEYEAKKKEIQGEAK